jgi:hypothetical protein
MEGLEMATGSMSKPDDIPQDVWDAAINAASAAVREDDPGFYITKRATDVLMEASARAILAERERCAVIADTAAGDASWQDSTDWALIADKIADAIREPA